MTSANLTFSDASFRSASLSLDTYHLNLDLREVLNRDVFPVEVTLTLTSSSPTLFLDYLGAEVTEVRVDKQPVDFQFSGSRIEFAVPTNQPCEIFVAGLSNYSRSGQGLHRFVDPSDNQTYLYSHLEPSDARRIYPCVDQPDLKAHFVVSMQVPDGWVALSNQPEVTCENGRHFFNKTPLLSTYITAFAAGPYVVKRDQWVSPSGAVVDLGVWSRASMAEFVDDEILTVTKQGMDFFDQAYGFPYPWGKYDSIFVPEYNLGAMENPGLVTFTEHYIFRSPVTDAMHATRANTILHEMSHMWFGDLVTPKWWDDLWLKESFAEFMGADASVAATRFSSAWASFAGSRKLWALMQDQLPTTHPIKADIPDVDAARQNFDGITYAKGASVLKQLVHYVGREEFYAAAREYFQTFAFRSASFDDLLTVLQRHTTKDLSDWSQRWLKTTGPDVLTAELTHADGTITTLGITQTSATSTRPHRLDVALYRIDPATDALSEYALFDATLSGEGTIITEASGLPTPDLIVINSSDHTYAKVVLDPVSLRTLDSHLSTLSDPLVRAVVWSSLWNMTRDAALPVDDFLNKVLAHIAKETQPALCTQMLANTAFAITHFLPEHKRKVTFQRLTAGLWELLLQQPAGSDHQLLFAQAFISAASSTDPTWQTQLRQILAGELDGLVLSPSIRWAVLTSLSTLGATTVSELDEQLAADHTLTGAVAHMRAKFAAPVPAHKDEIFDLLQTPGAYSNDEVDGLLAAYKAPLLHQHVDHTDRFFAALSSLWADHPIEIANRLIRGLFPHSPETLDRTTEFLSGDVPGALRRILLEEHDHLRRALHAQTFNQ
ncbi:aminopeptidase N [Corynebacterium sp. HS2168-gen11]|nr:aminopeptidase N [Corynebacterium sp. HS2168-gen11]